MKKLLSILLCLLLVISLGACGKKGDSKPEDVTNPNDITEQEIVEENVFEEIEIPETTTEIGSLTVAEPKFGMCQALVDYEKLNLDFKTVSTQLVVLKDNKESGDKQGFISNATAVTKYFSNIFNYSVKETESNRDFSFSSTLNEKEGNIIIESDETGTTVTILVNTKNLKSLYEEFKFFESVLGTNLFEDTRIVNSINKLTNSYDFEDTNSSAYTMLNIDVEDLSSTGLNHINYCVEALTEGFRVRCEIRLSDTYYADIKNGTFEY